MNGFDEAMILAATKHAGQKRRDGTPYIYHPVGVAAILKEAGFDEAHQIVGLLHDLLEDTDTTAKDLEPFGEDVVDAVVLLTRIKGMPEEEYVSSILKNELASAVKSADKVYNLIDCVSGPIGAKRSAGSRSFAKYYIGRAKEHYEGRLCPAVDQAIGIAELADWNKYYQKVKYPDNLRDGMLLFAVAERKRLSMLADCQKAGGVPDLARPDVWLFRIGSDGYYCAYADPEQRMNPGKLWTLTEIGWVPCSLDLWQHFDEIADASPEEINQNQKHV